MVPVWALQARGDEADLFRSACARGGAGAASDSGTSGDSDGTRADWLEHRHPLGASKRTDCCAHAPGRAREGARWTDDRGGISAWTLTHRTAPQCTLAQALADQTRSLGRARRAAQIERRQAGARVEERAHDGALGLAHRLAAQPQLGQRRRARPQALEDPRQRLWRA